MTKENAIPIPDHSGSNGTQLAADTSQVFLEARPLNGLHIASAIEGLAATNTRAFGGDVASVFIAAATRQIAQDCNDLKSDNRRLADRIESKRDEMDKIRTHNAVLLERFRSDGKNKHLRNLGITVGTALIGVGVALSRVGQDGYSSGAFVFGVLLLILGWFSGPKEEKV